MMKRLWVLSVFLPFLLWSLPAHAVEVDTSGGWAYEQVGDAKYQLVWIKGSGGSSGTTLGGCTATAAAPTYTEGETEDNSCDLSGNARFTLGTLLSGEDQPNNLLMTSGGKVRVLVVATGMIVGGDATMTTAVELPVGTKTFEGSVAGTGAVTQVQVIYGGFVSPITATNGTPICTLTLSGTTAKYDWCPVVTASFPYYGVLTSGTTGTSATGVVKAGY